MDEVFFFIYHLKMNRKEVLQMPIHERKWLAKRYVQQRDMEWEHIEQQKAKARR